MELDFTQRSKLNLVSTPKSYASAACTSEWISLKNYERVRFVIATGAWAGGTSAVTVREAINVAGSSSAALAFPSYYTGTAETMTKTTATSNTFNLAAASTKYVIEIKASDLTPGKDCVSVVCATPGANADFYCILAEVYGARYEGSLPASITD